MISIYLVDDEPMAIRYMQMLLENCGFPCRIAGTQTNSTRAWYEIKAIRPDIVFTDISMPVMDGLELAEEILKLADIRVYLLTSYEDFEFAKKGVKIGVSDYLLKNELTEEMLRNLLEEASSQIDASRRERQMILEHNIREFLLGSSDVPEDHVYEERAMQRYALLTFYKLPRFRIDPDIMENENITLDSFSLQNLDFPKGLRCVAFAQIRPREYCAVVFISETVVDSGRRVFQMADVILSGIAGSDPDWKCVCSDICLRFFDLQAQYRRLAACTAYLYTQGDQAICSASDIEASRMNNASADGVLEEIYTLIGGGRHEETVAKTKRFFELCRACDTQPAYMEHMRSLYQLLRRMTLRDGRGTEYLALSSCYAGTINLERALLNCVELYFEERERAAKMQYSEHVLQAQKFIHREYVRDISVSDIAASVGISEGHLRRLFKQEMNLSVIDYLTEYRIQQAKRLLQGRLKPASDVWKETGFSSAQYFGYVFKKREGVSPKEYQKQAGA